MTSRSVYKATKTVCSNNRPFLSTMPSFLSNLAGKAQNAINASPLASKLPHGTGARPESPDGSTQPPANQAAAQGGRSHAFDALSYQFRNLQQTYITSSSTSPAQKIITAEKGLILDFDNVGREAKAQSKELYTWGQNEPEDLKDVTDRMAYLNFVQGSLASALAQKLDAARAPLKALRDAETALQPRRSARAALEAQLVKVGDDPKKGGDLREQLRKAEFEDSQAEKEVELLKRKGLKESEQLKWTAFQEYAEKLLLLTQAATPILNELPTLPPTPTTRYDGFQRTGAVRASLQQALDNHRPGVTHFNVPSAGADLGRSDTRSFGESHAHELSSINNTPAPLTPHPDIQVAQPPLQQPIPTHAPVPHIVPSFPVPSQASPPLAHAPHPSQVPPPLDPSSLNQAPAPIPESVIATPPSQEASAGLTGTGTGPAPVPVITPTIAETGLPLSAGTSGPGPAKGSLHDLKHASSQAPGVLQSPPPAHEPSPLSATPLSAPSPAPITHESAEQEKKRLAVMYSQAQQQPSAGGPAPAGTSTGHAAKASEGAEEEKKRLEREERERILSGQPPQAPRKDGEPDEDLPPYQEPGLQ